MSAPDPEVGLLHNHVLQSALSMPILAWTAWCGSCHMGPCATHWTSFEDWCTCQRTRFEPKHSCTIPGTCLRATATPSTLHLSQVAAQRLASSTCGVRQWPWSCRSTTDIGFLHPRFLVTRTRCNQLPCLGHLHARHCAHTTGPWPMHPQSRKSHLLVTKPTPTVCTAQLRLECFQAESNQQLCQHPP